MNNNDLSSTPLSPGHIVFCDYLHLNEAKRDPRYPEPICANKHQYIILGKSRPVLIIQKLDEVDGTIWYRICKITRKQNKRQIQIPIGVISEGKGSSYANLESECYPDNLLKGTFIKEIDKQLLKSIVNRIGDLILGRRD